MRAENILQTIGNTPHVRINNLFDQRVDVWMKLERANPGGSIKDRIGLSMGNTGVGLAIVAAVKGYRLILVMPESMTVERRMLMAAYGAKFELTSKEKGMKGAIEKATELVAEIENAWMPQQFENQANIDVHKNYTAQEILRDFPDGIDYLISGVGTGGHLTG